MREKLIGPREVAELLAVPVGWVYFKSERGHIPSIKVGRYRRFVPAEIQEWLEERREPVAPVRKPDTL